ncbi:TetR/AcrR family transcriptional regulator [Mycolicibacterium sp. CH28]|uniref:TetR/AcrR family transcriptional regulator n=1 Tax=Mycolicibacterium sp. CH28 TaxID=2512237 RepID=UPI0010816DC9|nr:TetR/AcrR family transcriptional regulator [Mycolicibacterium sp. CH28]TGD88144.1 TetR/AcrR family transcriptional regulator [Mycolicibacterium sp. CH28]
MATTRAGRPRLTEQRRPGTTAREEILDAAGELFTTRGYASTSTRAIAEAVGIRQASLYHYFKTKDELLSALLHQTVTPTLGFLSALRQADPQLSAERRLHALAAFDGAQLLTSRWNLGALYLLPELREARLATFWTERERLRLGYLDLSRVILAATGVADDAADLPFRLVESLVNMWTHPPQPERAALPRHVADACLRVLGVTDEPLAALQTSTRDCLARYAEADELRGLGVVVG